MPQFKVYGTVSGIKYIGTVEAANKEEAVGKGWELEDASVDLCWQCAEQCDGAEIAEIFVEEDK